MDKPRSSESKIAPRRNLAETWIKEFEQSVQKFHAYCLDEAQSRNYQDNLSSEVGRKRALSFGSDMINDEGIVRRVRY
jgi:hypothetical protein